jgi:hypothetical protein
MNLHSRTLERGFIPTEAQLRLVGMILGGRSYESIAESLEVHHARVGEVVRELAICCAKAVGNDNYEAGFCAPDFLRSISDRFSRIGEVHVRLQIVGFVRKMWILRCSHGHMNLRNERQIEEGYCFNCRTCGRTALVGGF